MPGVLVRESSTRRVPCVFPTKTSFDTDPGAGAAVHNQQCFRTLPSVLLDERARSAIIQRHLPHLYYPMHPSARGNTIPDIRLTSRSSLRASGIFNLPTVHHSTRRNRCQNRSPQVSYPKAEYPQAWPERRLFPGTRLCLHSIDR